MKGTGCGGCVSRRGFLAAAGCAGCAGALGLVGRSAWGQQAGGGRLRIRIVYALHAPVQDRPDWPNVRYDFRPEMEGIAAELGRRCSGMEFVTSMATGPEQAQAIAEADAGAGIDGYVVYQFNPWLKVVDTLAGTGRPVLHAAQLYGGGGGILITNARLMREGVGNVGFVASTRMEDLAAGVECFRAVKAGGSADGFAAATARVRAARTRAAGDMGCLADEVKMVGVEECLAQLKGVRMLAVQNQEARVAEPIMGMSLEFIPFAEVNEAWAGADKDEARAVAERWRSDAAAVVEVSQETLENSAAMYLGMKAVMKRHGAEAITVNCLGGFYGGHIHAYPCLGFYELANEGLVGACECDVRSTATMMLVNKLTGGRPGYISDPVIDTSKRQIIYAHCVASNRVFGPGGAVNPYTIMTHSEDRQGAAVRSLLPVGYMTTTLKVDQARREIVFHQGKAVANDPDDRACRTKICVEPTGDFEKLFREWDQWGWHRVTCYGDLREGVFGVAEGLGWKVVVEG